MSFAIQTVLLGGVTIVSAASGLAVGRLLLQAMNAFLSSQGQRLR
jgi:hypothetical protein